jgi:hypothetical protein
LASTAYLKKQEWFMMLCSTTKKCVEQFVEGICEKVNLENGSLEGPAIMYGLYAFLEELQMRIIDDACNARLQYFNACWCGEDFVEYIISDEDMSCKSEVKKYFDFAQNVCKLIGYGDVYDAFFTLIALVCKWEKAIYEEWKDFRKAGDDVGF